MQYLVMVEDTLKDYMAIGREIRTAIADADIPKETKIQILTRIQDGFARHIAIGSDRGTEADS
jgi:hypothetical protein